MTDAWSINASGVSALILFHDTSDPSEFITEDITDCLLAPVCAEPFIAYIRSK